MDDIYYRKRNSGTAGVSERFGYGREMNNDGVSRLSPSFEDYGDIFGSFHSSRASSIPIIKISAVEEAEVFFDVGTPEFEYGEVFGEFDDGLDFEMPHETLIDQPKGGDDDSIQESWTPVGTEHPIGDSGTYERSLGWCEVSEGGKKGAQKSLQVADNSNSKQDLSVEMGNENDDRQAQNGDGISASPLDTTVLAVSNIVLKTKPSQIPPPCRPPPIVHVQEDCMFASSSQASTSCTKWE